MKKRTLAEGLLPGLLRDVDGEQLEQLVARARELAGEGLLVPPPLQQAHRGLHGPAAPSLPFSVSLRQSESVFFFFVEARIIII